MGDPLHAAVDGELQIRLAERSTTFERLVHAVLDAGEPLIVDADEAQHMRRLAATRVDPSLAQLERDTRQAQLEHGRLLDRRDLPLDPGEAAASGEPLAQHGRIDTVERAGQGDRGRLGIVHQERVADDRERDDIAGQELAMAVGDGGPAQLDALLGRAWRGRRRARAGAGHVDEAKTDAAKGQHEADREQPQPGRTDLPGTRGEWLAQGVALVTNHRPACRFARSAARAGRRSPA